MPYDLILFYIYDVFGQLIREDNQGLDKTAIGIYNGISKTCNVTDIYDAWGNCTVTNSADYSIAYSNPIRYRGYYHDRGTGLYYLNARYYNPLWRIFISPDSIDYLDPESVNGLNLYAYCNNDPVNYCDPSGNLGVSLAVLGAIVFGIIGAATGGVIAYNVAKDNGAEGWDLVGWTTLGILGGGLIGAALGYGVGALVTKLTGIIGLSITKYAILPIKNITVLGNMGTYVDIATTISAGYFSITPKIWELFSNTGKWLSNMKYLEDANSLGSQFVITPEKVVEVGTTLWKEIHFLIENSIPWIMP